MTSKKFNQRNGYKLLALLEAALHDELPVDSSDIDLQQNARTRQGQQSSGRFK